MAENDFTYNFSPNGFKAALDKMGVQGTTMAVFDTVAETVPELSYENFKDGTFYGGGRRLSDAALCYQCSGLWSIYGRR